MDRMEQDSVAIPQGSFGNSIKEMGAKGLVALAATGLIGGLLIAAEARSTDKGDRPAETATDPVGTDILLPSGDTTNYR